MVKRMTLAFDGRAKMPLVAAAVWVASKAHVEGVVVVREPTEMLPFTVTLVAKVAALLTPRVPVAVMLLKVTALVVPRPIAVRKFVAQ